jgi:hypothetical protein
MFISPEMLIYKRKYSTCLHEHAEDLTKGKAKNPNIFCPDCHTHWYKGKEYNPHEWDEYIGEI